MAAQPIAGLSNFSFDFKPQTYKLSAPQESAADLRKKVKQAEKRERKERERAKAQKRETKACAQRRQIALDALVRVAQTGDDRAAVTAAENASGSVLMDLRGMLAVEALTDALADQLANAYCLNTRSSSYTHTYELARQELAMAVTDTQTMLYGVPDCEAEYERTEPFDYGMGV